MSKQMKLINLFDREELVYLDQTKLKSLDLAKKLDAIATDLYLPKKFTWFTFTLDFNDVIYDPIVSGFCDYPEHLYTIGFKGKTQVVNRTIFLSEIGLNDNVSLITINERVQELLSKEICDISLVKLDLLELEYKFAQRICVNFEKDGCVIVIEPEDLSHKILNSSIEKLVDTIACIQEKFNVCRASYGEGFNSDILEDMFNSMTSDLKKIDPFALSDENCLWNEIIETAILDIESD